MSSVVFLSLPGLREKDAAGMKSLQSRARGGGQVPLSPHFPAVTWPVQANFITGKLPNEHGVVANGFFWRDRGVVEMWTAKNSVIQASQIWDDLHEWNPPRRSAVWFPMLSKESGADYVCMPAPIHNPDGSESLWCYTTPREFYGELLDRFGHFPLQHFWGPLANIESSKWIAQTAAFAFEKFHPDFFYLYLPHLDYAAQKTGPDSAAAAEAVEELDGVLEAMMAQFEAAADGEMIWIWAGEYAITDVDHVVYPNRLLREAGWLKVQDEGNGGEQLDVTGSPAWTLVDHQCGHVFVHPQASDQIPRIAAMFSKCDGIAEVLTGEDRRRYGLDHARSGEIVLVSAPNSWQAYYWWEDDARAPAYARTVDIHRKPGYDPVELFFDPATRSIPLEATLVKGSHGAPVTRECQKAVLGCSCDGLLPETEPTDIDVRRVIERALQAGS